MSWLLLSLNLPPTTTTTTAVASQRLSELRQSAASSETFTAAAAQALAAIWQSLAASETFASTAVQHLGAAQQSASATVVATPPHIAQLVGALGQALDADATTMATPPAVVACGGGGGRFQQSRRQRRDPPSPGSIPTLSTVVDAEPIDAPHVSKRDKERAAERLAFIRGARGLEHRQAWRADRLAARRAEP